jgi:hypothetical protein
MIVAGADPGFDGAIAFLEVDPLRVVGIVDMPTAKKKSGRRELALHELVGDCLQVLDGRRCGHLIIERVNSFAPAGRRMGASSAFSLGECAMAVRMLAACHGWPVTMIAPGQWKRVFSLSADKAQARLRASELLPADAVFWTQKRGLVTVAQANGRAEATLLALYGTRTLSLIEQEKAA